MKLGHRVSHIRHQEIYVKDHPERRAELDALGLRWRGPPSNEFINAVFSILSLT